MPQDLGAVTDRCHPVPQRDKIILRAWGKGGWPGHHRGSSSLSGTLDTSATTDCLVFNTIPCVDTSHHSTLGPRGSGRQGQVLTKSRERLDSDPLSHRLRQEPGPAQGLEPEVGIWLHQQSCSLNRAHADPGKPNKRQGAM